MATTQTKTFNYGLLRFLREDKGWSLNEAAIHFAKAGFTVTPQTLSNWENKQGCPDADDLPKLAQVLGCNVDDFYRPNNDR